MSKNKKTEADHIAQARSKLVSSILQHVEFDGWSPESFQMAVADSGLDEGLCVQAAPRGAIDIAHAFHKLGDDQMLTSLAKTELDSLKFREKVSMAIRLRLTHASQNKEAIRRAASLYALPQNIGEGSQLVWGTSDAIWNFLGDTSEDVNWYTKRASLSAVYSSCLLFWLGDTSDDHSETWAFLDRRIENVMEFEKVKARLKDTIVGRGISGLFDKVVKPNDDYKSDFPGYTKP